MHDGIFGWKRRMGVHLAYHRSFGNKVIHGICIPLVLASLVKLSSLVSIGGIDLAWIAIAGAGGVCCLVDPLGGALMLAWLTLSHRLLAHPIGPSPWYDAAGSGAAFVLLFIFQTRVGHGVYEGGPDDTDQNMAELGRTWNPIPLVLVLYYHLVELLFWCGYRPETRKQVEAFMRAEIERMGAQ